MNGFSIVLIKYVVRVRKDVFVCKFDFGHSIIGFKAGLATVLLLVSFYPWGEH